MQDLSIRKNAEREMTELQIWLGLSFVQVQQQLWHWDKETWLSFVKLFLARELNENMEKIVFPTDTAGPAPIVAENSGNIFLVSNTIW